MKCLSIFLAFLPVLVLGGDKSTAFNIQNVQCSKNTATISEASCGTSGGSPCRMGEHVSISGTYTVSSSLPKEVEVCTKVQVYGMQVYNAGCKNVNVCEYLENWYV